MTYFISDIHGENTLFERLLDKVGFCSSDTLFVLGDMIDKGTESVRVLKSVYSLPNAVCVQGNHEYDFLKYYRALMERTVDDFDGVLNKLQSYFPEDNTPLDWDLLDWLDGLPYYILTDDFIGVHAGVPLTETGEIKPLEKAIAEQFVYDRTFKEPDTFVNDKRTVLFGHTPASYINGTGEIILYPRRNGRGYARVHLDTGVYLTGMLGCFCFETGKCFYVKKACF